MPPDDTAQLDLLTRDLLAVLPIYIRLISASLRQKGEDEATMVQMRVLTHLMEGPITLSALAKKRRITLQAASEHIQGLVDRGWVVRVPDPNDRRQALLHLTDEGRTRLEESGEYLVNVLKPIMARLTPDEQRQAMTVLEALRRIFAEHEDAAQP